jgi:membrane protein involved in colicin uptake
MTPQQRRAAELEKARTLAAEKADKERQEKERIEKEKQAAAEAARLKAEEQARAQQRLAELQRKGRKDQRVARANAKATPVTTDADIAAGTRSDEALFLRRLHRGACGTFGTVLGPEANEAHREHFHFDLAPRRRSAFCE